MKQKVIILLLTGLASISCSSQKSMAPYTYSVPDTKWDEQYGNHRAVIEVKSTAEAAGLSFEWRRPDNDVDKKLFLVINTETGDTIPNIIRKKVDNDICNIVFGPVEKGTYYFYYLPYQVQTGYGGYGRGYFPPEKEADALWQQTVNGLSSIQEATVSTVQARTDFDSFYPMEVAATEKETEDLRQSDDRPYRVFTEGREYPVRMRYKIPYKWLDSPKENISFQGKAMQNEYYAFQLAVWNKGTDNVSDIKYNTKGLSNGKHSIPAEAVTCFNIDGVDPDGNKFTKRIDLTPGFVQPLWFGLDIAEDQPAGTYKGIIEITDESGYATPVAIEIKVGNTVLADRGDNEPWRHSRLRWLNSTLGISDEPTTGYTDIKVDGDKVSCLGRSVVMDRNTALPGSIDSWGNELLSSPIRFVIQTSKGIKEINLDSKSSKTHEGTFTSTLTGKDDDLVLKCEMRMEFDGWLNYNYTIEPLKPVDIQDIRLEIPVAKKYAEYFMGMGLPGQYTPKNYSGKWDTPEKTVNNFGVSIPTSRRSNWLWPFDSFWCGNTKAGVHCELRGSSYHGPLLNLYRPAYPESWHNGGKGGFRVESKADHTLATVYSGSRNLDKGEKISFDFSLLITPVKEINYKSQFTDRYYHNGGAPVPTEKDMEAGIRIINVHHANYLNPFINYPFLTTEVMKDFIQTWHAKNCKVKLYYTIREFTNVITEIWALRSLGDEIIADGRGGGYTWCREHFVTGYTPQWYQHLDDLEYNVTADASVLTATGESRWYNYYIEGLAWLVKNLDIDGIYMDDVSFDRRILKRMRRAMDGVKEGCIIDLHSNTGFSRGPAMQYAEYFPYVDKLWFGESFMYSQMPPDNWLVEVSGIPFGHMGDMLHGGGNRWLGMQYGMTLRLPWLTEGVSCDPTPVWKVWDEFGIAESSMIGFWEDNPPVTVSDPDVKVTSYVKDGQTLISVGNYASTQKNVRLNIDWKALGLNGNNVTIEAPAVEDFQEQRTFKAGDVIPVEPKKGWLLIIKSK